jgi:non-specific serine/threonine protein kinase
MSTKNTQNRDQQHEAALTRARRTAQKLSNTNKKKARNTRYWVAGVLTLLVISALVVTFFLNTTPGARDTNTSSVPTNVTVTQETPNTYLVANTGKPGAPTLDVWEDPMCPHCKRFETTNNTSILRRVEAGDITVRYHLMNILDRASDTKDYSSRVIRAFEAASSDPGVFLRFHELVYKNAPREGASLSNDTIRGLLGDAGATGEQQGRFDELVRNLDDEGFAHALSDSQEKLRDTTGRIGVPAVMFKNQAVDFTRPDWLTHIH